MEDSFAESRMSHSVFPSVDGPIDKRVIPGEQVHGRYPKKDEFQGPEASQWNDRLAVEKRRQYPPAPAGRGSERGTRMSCPENRSIVIQITAATRKTKATVRSRRRSRDSVSAWTSAPVPVTSPALGQKRRLDWLETTAPGPRDPESWRTLSLFMSSFSGADRQGSPLQHRSSLYYQGN